MPLDSSPESAAARDLAKRCVPPDGQLEVGLLLAAVYHTAHLVETVPELSAFFDAPTACRDELPDKMPLAKDLVPSISSLAKRNEGPISPKELFVDLLWSPAGMS